MALVSNRRCFK